MPSINNEKSDCLESNQFLLKFDKAAMKRSLELYSRMG